MGVDLESASERIIIAKARKGKKQIWLSALFWLDARLAPIEKALESLNRFRCTYDAQANPSRALWFEWAMTHQAKADINLPLVVTEFQ
jgi:hypothetical protein